MVGRGGIGQALIVFAFPYAGEQGDGFAVAFGLVEDKGIIVEDAQFVVAVLLFFPGSEEFVDPGDG